jgi:hypothetical protein
MTHPLLQLPHDAVTVGALSVTINWGVPENSERFAELAEGTLQGAALSPTVGGEEEDGSDSSLIGR